MNTITKTKKSFRSVVQMKNDNQRPGRLFLQSLHGAACTKNAKDNPVAHCDDVKSSHDFTFAPPPFPKGQSGHNGLPQRRHCDLRLAFSPLHLEQRLYIFPVNH